MWVFQWLSVSSLGAISRLETDNPLRQVALRQLAIKNESSKSWFTRVASLGFKYGLDIHNIIIHPWPKLAWKAHSRLLVSQHWYSKLREEASCKSTLQWLLLHDSWIAHLHPAWSCCRGKPYQTRAATVRVTLLTGRYGLQHERVAYTKQDISPICRLCNKEDEDVSHFLLRCPKRCPQTDLMIKDLQNMYAAENIKPPHSQHEITSAILNGWGYCSESHFGPCNCIDKIGIVSLNKKSIPANQLCNTICHHLHTFHNQQINTLLLRRLPGCNGWN